MSGGDAGFSVRQPGAGEPAVECFARHFRPQDRAHRDQSLDIDAGSKTLALAKKHQILEYHIAGGAWRERTAAAAAILTIALVSSPTCFGPAYPTVSATATKSTPASKHFSASLITSRGSTGPVIEQPSAIEIAALTIGLCGLASRNSQSRFTLAMA